MRSRTSILVICLAASSVGIGRTQTVYDRAGNPYTCRTPGSSGTVYSKDSPTVHRYDIKVAKDVGEHHPAYHDAICIDALNSDQIKWYWKNARNIAVTYFPMTNDTTKDGQCWKSTDPFSGTPSNSGNSDTLQSVVADKTYQWCAYKLQFNSSAGAHDPHIIIKGDPMFLEKQLEDRATYLEKKEIPTLEKLQK